VLTLGVVVPGVVLLLLAAYGDPVVLSPFAVALDIGVAYALLASALWAIGGNRVGLPPVQRERRPVEARLQRPAMRRGRSGVVP
jgi:hypothetical protein